MNSVGQVATEAFISSGVCVCVCVCALEVLIVWEARVTLQRSGTLLLVSVCS